MKSPMNKITKKNSPFGSDSESNNTKQRMKPAARTSSEQVPSDLKSNPFDDDDGRKPSSSSHTANMGGRNSYRNDFSDFENQSSNPFDDDDGRKPFSSSHTSNLGGRNSYQNDFSDSSGFDNCLKIAEDIREDASEILGTLHQQGEQITRTHGMYPDFDQNLEQGEKSLGSLGGMFSRPWKPKKTRAITGPLITSDDSSKAKASKQQREKLGIASIPKGPKNSRGSAAESSSAMQKVEEEKDKKDDALDKVSNILGDLKSMAIDMGSELERQTKTLEHLDTDTDELNSRVKQANERGRRLLGK
ncbi:hypothetical protein MKX03_001920 [Papaver bracteatum]|nr:hypothetical protein MKX03_001920 [Papaver bracteatum]